MDELTQVIVLDAVTRDDVGSAYVLPTAPRSGRVNVQVCRTQVEQTTQVLLSLDAGSLGVADSAPFALAPRPDYVRCVNKRTYQIREYPAKRCPAGWVKR